MSEQDSSGAQGAAGLAPATAMPRLFVASGTIHYQIVVLAADEKAARDLVEYHGEEEIANHIPEELRFVQLSDVLTAADVERKWRTAIPYMDEEHEDDYGDKTVTELVEAPPVVVLRDNRTLEMFTNGGTK